MLRDVEARLGRGEITILLGRSGSGKSTLLNLLSGIDLPDEGEVLVDGVAINRLSETDRTRYRRRRIGFVFQFFNLIPTLTVAENLLLPLELNRPTRPPPPDRRAAGGGGPGRPRRQLSRPSCPAASASGWRSPAPWCTTPT